MAMFASYPCPDSLTLVVSPHRAGLTVAEAYALITSINVEDMETDKDLVLRYSLTEIAESLIEPHLHLPDPAEGFPIAFVRRHGQRATQALADEWLARWDHAYSQALIHEPL